MPRAILAEGEFYHIFNRGVEKRIIFLNDEDRWRFITLLIVCQGDTFISQMSRMVSDVKHQDFRKTAFTQILEMQYVELVSFCLMPNHFHLILDEVKEGGISKFMQRVSDAYTKYFNIKYERVGHLFGGKFQSQHINSTEYLNYVSAYVHLNPRELRGWRKREVKYSWSSFQDYVLENRWGKFLNPAILLDQFNSKKEYQAFVEETPIKEIKETIINLANV